MLGRLQKYILIACFMGLSGAVFSSKIDTGSKHADLEISINQGNLVRSCALSANCSITVSRPSSYCLPQPGMITIKNNSKIIAHHIQAKSSDPNYLAYVVQTNNCPADLLPGASCTISFHTPNSSSFFVPNILVRGSNTVAMYFDMQVIPCPEYSVSGSVSGLFGTLVLQNNGGDPVSVSSNGVFTFPTGLPSGSPYSVTVRTQPATQTCTVTNGSGTMGGTDVTDVLINCAVNATTLTISPADLALSVLGLDEFGLPGSPASGLPRVITITNTGSAPAVNLSVTPPTWPTGTTSSTTCGSTLAAGGSCTLTVTPGTTATSDGTNPCSTTGTAPVPGVVQVTADNASTVSSNVVVLSYGCIYQNGYVFAFNDTTPNTASVGGKAATTMQLPISPFIIWSVNYDTIYGIAEDSTTGVPNPSTGQVAGQTACDGATDGLCATNNIYIYYQNDAPGAPIDLNDYAVGLCKQTISGYNDWYLPAICEMGYDSANLPACGNSSSPVLQNMQSSLVEFNGLNLLAGGGCWSSTVSTFPAGYIYALLYTFTPGGGDFHAGSGDRLNTVPGLYCVRTLT